MQKYEEIILLLLNFQLEKDLLFDKINYIFNSSIMKNLNDTNKELFFYHIKKILLDIYKNPDIFKYDFDLIAVSIFIFISNYLNIGIKINKFANNFNLSAINDIMKFFFTC